MRLDVLSTCVLAFIAATASAAPRGEALSARDLDDRVVRPLDDPTAKAVVLLFVRTDCPISNRYAPEVQRLGSALAARGRLAEARAEFERAIALDPTHAAARANLARARAAGQSSRPD